MRLANGDRLFARPEKIDETHLSARWTVATDRPVVRIPLEAVRDALFDLPHSAARRRELFAKISRASDSGDVALLTNGDRIAGELVGLDAESLVLQVGDDPLRIARNTLRGIRFDPELVGLPPAKGKRVIVESTDGSWITGRAPRLKAGRLVIEAEFRAPLELPLETVHAIRFLGRKATYLSDLEPAAYRHTPYLGSGANGPHVRPAGIDRSIAGDVLRLRGVSYPKGLGLPGGAEIRYDLDERYTGFRAVIGIDDATEGGGHAVFVVETDSERIYESPPLTGRSPAVKVGPLDLTGARTLTLRVEYGARGDILDDADWAEAVIFR